jgi:CO dehydrogenase/acetyl-CoA synthase delta subunit
MQIQIQAILKYRNKAIETELKENEFDPTKIMILSQIEARIQKIKSTLGVFKNQSPEKITAWMRLYEKLYLEPDVTEFSGAIEEWKLEQQNVNGSAKSNFVIISDQRAKCGLWESDKSQSIVTLNTIEGLLDNHDNQSGTAFESV